jgi:multidrug efflux pump subunit AcrB
MNFSALSIRNPIPAILLFALLTLAGLLAFRGAGIQDFPDIELPVVTVSASLPGAAPGTLETEVARKLENSIATLAQIKKMYTTILDGEVSISIEFELEKNANEAETEVRAAVSRVRSDLPADVRDPVVAKILTAGRPLGAWTLTSDTLDEEALSWRVDDTVTRRLLAVKGVGAVKRMGGLTRELRVELDADPHDRPRGQRGRTCRASCAGPSWRPPAAAATWAAASRPYAPSPPSPAPRPWRPWTSLCPAGRSVRLERIATITDTTAERRSVALLDGKPVVGFEVSRTRGASEITVTEGVVKAVAELQAAHPELHFTHAYDNVAAVQENFDGSMQLLYEGALLAVLVVWWFLRDWRATLVAALALPLSVIPTFLGMYWFGFTLNTVTLLSLALVVGILVDDAIVEIENIARHLRMGKTPLQAAMEAADEIGMAVIATTFALVAVFLPTAFMAGIAGKFFKQFGWTAVLAIIASLVVARLLTPMMAAYLLGGPSGGQPRQPHHDRLSGQRPLVPGSPPDHGPGRHPLLCRLHATAAPAAQGLCPRRRPWPDQYQAGTAPGSSLDDTWVGGGTGPRDLPSRPWSESWASSPPWAVPRGQGPWRWAGPRTCAWRP